MPAAEDSREMLVLNYAYDFERKLTDLTWNENIT
jgi:hypothetical protein